MTELSVPDGSSPYRASESSQYVNPLLQLPTGIHGVLCDLCFPSFYAFCSVLLLTDGAPPGIFHVSTSRRAGFSSFSTVVRLLRNPERRMGRGDLDSRAMINTGNSSSPPQLSKKRRLCLSTQNGSGGEGGNAMYVFAACYFLPVV